MIEEWKWILDFEGLYQISNTGKVRSVDRRVLREGKYMSLKGKSRCQKTDKHGYFFANLSKEGKCKNVWVHKAVAQAFCLGFFSEAQVCHNDGDKSNNSAGNLRWDSRSGNQKDRLGHGTLPRGEKHPAHKLTTKQAQQIFELSQNPSVTNRELAKKFGVSKTTISCIKNGRRRWDVHVEVIR